MPLWGSTGAMSSRGTLFTDYLAGASDDMRRRYVEYERKRRDRALLKRNIAAMADFASNILVTAARAKGARGVHPSVDASLSAAKGLESAQERYMKALIDYKGKIASEKIPISAMGGSSAVPSAIQVQPLTERRYAADGGAARATDIVSKIKQIKNPVWHSNYK